MSKGLQQFLIILVAVVVGLFLFRMAIFFVRILALAIVIAAIIWVLLRIFGNK